MRKKQNKLGITPGDWHVVGLPWNTQSPYIIAGHHDPQCGIAILDSMERDGFEGEDDADIERQYQEWQHQQEVNANLVADAGTTANKTGLLPSELAAQRNELLDALEYALPCLESDLRDAIGRELDSYAVMDSQQRLDAAKAAIKKAGGVLS